MQKMNYGRIENLSVRGGEPIGFKQELLQIQKRCHPRPKGCV